MTAVHSMYRPDVAAMTTHVQHLFGGWLGGYEDGLVELAWTPAAKPPEGGRQEIVFARMFGTDELDELVELAARLNTAPYCNMYIGAALRHPDTPRDRRSKDIHTWCLPAPYTDLDDMDAFANAKGVYEVNKPTLIVITGKFPHGRAQLWWRLDEPLTDVAAWPALLHGIATRMAGDHSVCNASRLMRLAGSVAWPVKDGRTFEVTGIHPLREPGLPVYMPEHLAMVFPPDPRRAAMEARVVRESNPEPTSDPENDPFGVRLKIDDGRERYMRNTVLACLIEYIGTTGAVPDEQELFDLAWPQYERKVNLTRPGRGPKEMLAKCRYTLERFRRGELRGLRTVEEVVEVYRRKASARMTWEGMAGPAPPKSSPISVVDFYTLLTEQVVEEPDYIEPAFAGAGNFVLIAGPPKAQKSFLLQEMLVACATSGPCLAGVLSVPRPLRVFYLQAEMNRKLLRKRAREFSMLSREQQELLKINLIMSERFAMILNESGVAVAIETIRSAFPQEPPDIIAVDPLANLFDGESENDNAQLMRFISGRLEVIRQRVNPLACIILVHHSTKKGVEDLARDPFVAIRGAGALRGYYDSAIVIYRKSEEGKTRRAHFELRGGESPEPIDVELVDGRFQKLIGTSGLPSKDVCRRILTAMGDAWRSGRPWSPYPEARKEGRYTARNMFQLFEVPPEASLILVEEWMKNGVITFRERVYRKHPAGFEVTGSID